MQMFDLELRDTDPHDSDVLNLVDKLRLNVFLQKITIYYDNNLDKTVSINVKVSPNGTKFFDTSPTITVSAGEDDYAVLTEWHPYVKVVVQCSEVPTQGAIKVWVEAS